MSINYKKFFSNSKYIFLPTKYNPKVALAIDNNIIKENSFKLYNPFSKKAKILKLISKKYTFLFKPFGFIEKKEKSEFIYFFEDLFKKKFKSSIYFSTDKNKVIVQLQTTNGKVLAYVKIALNELGKKRLFNEKKGIEILNKVGISTPEIITYGNYKNYFYLVFKPINGNVKFLKNAEILQLLNKLKKNKKYKIDKHPAVTELINFFKNIKYNFFLNKLKEVIKNENINVNEVYEHGDFTPWNIIKSYNKLILFDLELFEEKGLEYLDLIKYNFQIEKLLKHKKRENLLHSVMKKVNLEFTRELLIIFLLKEIKNKIVENNDFKEEKLLLKLCEKI